MKSKKVYGYLLITLAIILSLSILGQLQALIAAIFGIFTAFSGKLNGYESGKLVGHFIYWVAHITLTVVSWKYGLRWTKKPQKTA